MKKRIVGAFSLLGIVIGGLTFAVQSQNKAKSVEALYTPSTHYEVSDTASELTSYYSSVGSGDTGDTLLTKLRSINSSKYHKNFSYKNFGTSSSTSPYVYTDYPIGTTTKDSNGQIRGSSIASFYTKTTSDSFNKEHVWPNSKGGNQVENDILMPRPTISSENSSRGNSNFVEGMNSSSGGWDPYTAGYDIECRGECARIMLYCVVASSQLSLVASNSGSSTSCGNMNTLIKWHFDYAPSDYEMNRNNGAEYLQGNRNPFVDHPEYVAKIWSDFNSTVSSLCTSNQSKYSNWTPGSYCAYGTNTPVNNNGVSISASTASVTVGSTTTLSATSSDSGTITWTTSNSSVASLSSSSSASGANITITGVSAGTATITAKRTINGTQYSQTCTVTVTKVVSSLSKGSTSPTKTTYTAGESFDPTGLTITATYSDSTTGNVTSSVVWTPDPLTAGTTSVTGTYGGKTIAISGLTVNAAAEPDSYSIVPTDLANGTYPTSATSYTAASGISVTAYNTANFSSKIQFKKSGGYLYNDSSLNLGTLTLSGASGTLTVYAGTTKNPSSTTISGSNGVYDLSGYNYFKIINNSGSVATCSSITVELAEEAKTLSSISVSTAPTKTTYTAGEYFDPTGLVITRTYSDSTSDTYTYASHTSEFTFNPTTSTALTTSNTSVTITYGGKSTSQAITVNAAKTLSSISVSTAPTKTSYYAGQTFDPTGLVIRRTYSDSTYDIYTYANHTSEFSFTPSTSTALTTSNTSVTIAYGGKTCTQSISVSAVTLTSIAVSTAPTKTTYVVDETFDPTGLVITRNYSNSTSDTYTYAGHTSEFSFNPSLSTALTVANISVTITYGGKSCSQTITVSTSGGGSQTEDNPETITMSEQGFSNTQEVTEIEGANATVMFAKNDGNNAPKYYDSGSAVRVYPKNTITVSSSLTIVKITITFGSGDGSNSITSSPSGWSSPDWTGSSNSVSFTIGGANGNRRISAITVYYEESGSTDPITSITASVSKTFYVGETISSSDITVKGNTGATVGSFTFANDGYQFTYSDAASGGASTSKTFADAISAESLTCSLTVQVQRKAYVTPSGTSTLEHTGSKFQTAGISAGKSASYFEENQTATVDGVTFTVNGYVFTNTSPVALSFSESKTSATGSLVSTTPYPSGITDVTVSGASPDIQLSVDGSTWVDLSSATPETVNYYYLKVFYKNTSQNSYVNITSLTVTLKAGETPENVANYVMYEDTNNQCTTKFDTAKGYFENLSPSGRAAFMTSNDYVIATGRERLQAWAKHEGKQIVSQNGDYVITSASRISVLSMNENNSLIVVVITIASISFAGVLGLYILKRRKEQ